ncbi:hypothetical protein [Micromonospora sp. NBC_01813]|uniref:hypothetical protein n=1 Tax=Micromonospora sp. NBC_01813 TaxID=2975988 RepID=UPI002DDA9E35|nr:hypothetical protein [Micromonospora sp. NBC_01813]WSA12094.1 hypothetical protein OG958_15665 [Micromonospora sp. NBC_01813]
MRTAGRRAAALTATGRLAVLAGLVAAALAGGATPAAAHGADAPTATDYRVAVTGTAPAVDGLTVRVIEAGARLELTNHTGRPIEVLGYAGEPYLEIRPDGVYRNLRSPTAYQNETLAGDTPVPDDADPTAPPAWQRISTEPVARWHDQRTYWLDDAPPEAVRAAPDQQHRVRDWTVPLRDGVTAFELRGTLDWIPPPDPVRWWGGTLLAAVLGVVALTIAARRGPTAARRLSAAGLIIGGATAAGYALARSVEAGAAGPLSVLGALGDGPVWALLTGLGALAAAGYALTRRSGTEFVIALAGTCLAIFAGASNAAVFARAIAPVPGPGWWPRVAVAVVLAAGAVVALGAVLRMRAAAEPTRSGSAASTEPGGPVRGELTLGEQRIEADR